MGGQLPVLPLPFRLCLRWQQLMGGGGINCSISCNHLLVATSHPLYGLAKLENYKGNVCHL